MPLPRRSAEHGVADVAERRPLARLDAEPARPARRSCDRGAEACPGASWKVTSRTTWRPGSALNRLVAVAEAAVGVGEGADAAERAVPDPDAARWSGRPPGRRRRRSGSGSRRPSRGCRRAPRRRPSRARRRWRRARPRLSPAATVTSTPPQEAPSLDVGPARRGWRPRRPCRRSPRRRRPGCCRRRGPAPARRPRRRAATASTSSASVVASTQRAGRAAEPQRGVVAQQGSAQARTTALGMPSTFCPPQVTVERHAWSARRRRP